MFAHTNSHAAQNMIKLTQENRQAVIETPLGPDALMLQHFSGSEGLSKDFSYTMTVLSEDAAIDGNALVGKRISVIYNDEDGKKRHFNGFVSRFEYNQRVENQSRPQRTRSRWFHGCGFFDTTLIAKFSRRCLPRKSSGKSSTNLDITTFAMS